MAFLNDGNDQLSGVTGNDWLSDGQGAGIDCRFNRRAQAANNTN